MDEGEFMRMFMPPSEADLAAGLALVPQHVRDALPRTETCTDTIRRVKLHAPWNDGPYAGWSWYVISVAGTDDNLAYCYVDGFASEHGDVRLDTIAAIRGPRGQRVVRVEERHPNGDLGASHEESRDNKERSSDAELLEWDRAEFWESAEPAAVESLFAAEDADIRNADDNYKTALHMASSSNSNPEVVRALVRLGADVHARDWEGRTPLHDAAQFASEPGVIAALAEAGAEVNSSAISESALDPSGIASGQSPLHLAVACNDCLEIARALLDAGADPNQGDKVGITPLHACVGREGSANAIELLLEAGADIRAETIHRETPLHAAMMQGDAEAYDALSNAGAEPTDEMEQWVQEFLDTLGPKNLTNEQPTPRSQDTESRDRLVRTFKFLKALADLRRPEQRDLNGYLQVLRPDAWPAHPCIAIRRGDAGDKDDQDPANKDMEPLIRIARATLTHCPEPPLSLKDWLKPGWERVNDELDVLQSRNSRDMRTGRTVTVEFDDDDERVGSLNNWKAARAKWVEAERPAVLARKVFEKVYELWTTMEREGDRLEIVVADGMLCVEEHFVKHPVLLQRLGLDFDPSVPEFRFFAGMEKVELQRSLLRVLPKIDGTIIARFDQLLEEEPVDPLGGSGTERFLRSLVQGLFKDGDFLDGEPTVPTDRPCLWREPVIIVRPRTSGLSTTLDKIIEGLGDESSEIPDGLSRIMGVSEEASGSDNVGLGSAETPKPTLEPETDILFCKPANPEQREIASRLKVTKSVVVQGPPGTGKTHTIANLVGHFLSEGKTVLITAHTTKALRVLRSQIAKPLQPLCLSVLGGDSENQSQLSDAAREIDYRLSRSDPDRLRREAAELRSQRNRLLSDAENLQRQLRDARYSEIDEIVLGGEALNPIDVAKRVMAGSEADSWIPGPLEHGTLCPLSDKEVRELYASNRTLTAEEVVQLAEAQPDLGDLVTPSDFRRLAHLQTGAEARVHAHRPEFWDSGPRDGCTAARLHQLQQMVQGAAASLREEQDWLREVLYAGWTGGELGRTWEDLLGAMERLSRQAAAANRLAVEYGPKLPDEQPVEDVLPVLSEIVQFLEGGGSLALITWFTRHHWHRLRDACKVHGRSPRTLDEFRSLREVAQWIGDRDRFVARWRRLVQAAGGPSIDGLDGAPERIASAYAPEIRRRLDWRAGVWDPLLKEFGDVGFFWTGWLETYPPEPGDHGELARIRSAVSGGLDSIIEGHSALLRQTELSGELERQRSYLAGFPQSKAGAALQQAQESWEIHNYESSYRALSRLHGLRGVYERRLAVLAKLNETAPRWAEAIASRTEPHDGTEPPGEHTKAWAWRQWLQELERRAEISIDELQERYAKMHSDSLQLSARIIDCETWAAQCERTGLEQRQALTGFVQTMKKVGKGTGKRAPKLLRQARELLSSARRAVPVWIMPLSRVYESLDPRQAKFDVVIIDEASQSDVTALAALYLGRTHIVVGDKEQVTPDAIGQRMDDVERLVETELQGIPNRHLYDGQTSIYDLAEAAFGGVVALREHFRCVPEIIQFSNHLSYNNTIRPLREPSSAPVRPPVVSHRVNGYREPHGKSNEVEAVEIASLVAACLEDPAYTHNELGEPTSFGVISLLGDEQAYLIESKLRRHLTPNVFAKHRILCGNAAQFQGDQRDVVFLSLVDGPPAEGQLSLRDTGPNGLFKKRYNVAVSRARNQAWVIHSLDPDSHLKSGDIRRRLIEHARDPNTLMRAIEQQGEQTESEFERLVLARLVSAGYRVQAQWPVGAYRIDLVVVGESRRLAVECDGERWHTAEQLEKDLERQAVLERLGWIFARVRGSLFFRDQDKAMEAVFAKLQRLGIEPLGTVTEQEKSTADIELLRRAESIRCEWENELPEAAIEWSSSLSDVGASERRKAQ